MSRIFYFVEGPSFALIPEFENVKDIDFGYRDKATGDNELHDLINFANNKGIRFIRQEDLDLHFQEGNRLGSGRESTAVKVTSLETGSNYAIKRRYIDKYRVLESFQDHLLELEITRYLKSKDPTLNIAEIYDIAIVYDPLAEQKYYSGKIDQPKDQGVTVFYTALLMPILDSSLAMYKGKITCDILQTTMEAIAKMHKLGVIHRDLALENVSYNPTSGKITITDFGDACLHNKCKEHRPFDHGPFMDIWGIWDSVQRSKRFDDPDKARYDHFVELFERIYGRIVDITAQDVVDIMIGRKPLPPIKDYHVFKQVKKEECCVM